MLKVDYDPVRKIILTEASGFLTKEEVLGWADALPACMAQARKDGDIRHLVLGASASIQSAEIMDLFMSRHIAPEKPGDRIAVVVGTTLGKMQADRNLQTAQECSFLSEAEAIQWLQTGQ